MPPLHGAFCCITYPDGTGYNTMASSVFAAAARALEWVEVDCQTFGTAPLKSVAPGSAAVSFDAKRLPL